MNNLGLNFFDLLASLFNLLKFLLYGLLAHIIKDKHDLNIRFPKLFKHPS